MSASLSVAIFDPDEPEQFLCPFPTRLRIALSPDRQKEIDQLIRCLRAFERDAKVEGFAKLCDGDGAQILGEHRVADIGIRFAEDRVEHAFEGRIRFLPREAGERLEVGGLPGISFSHRARHRNQQERGQKGWAGEAWRKCRGKAVWWRASSADMSTIWTRRAGHVQIMMFCEHVFRYLSIA